MKKLITFLLITVIAFGSDLRAQHYQFSQFYAAQTYLNPAFTGANACSRLSINYRDQWRSIPGGFKTYQVSFDHYLKSLSSGVGLQFFSDEAGTSNLRTTQFSGLYSYQFQFNRDFAGRAGFNIGGVQRSINYNSLVFGDQIARGGAANSVENISAVRTTYFDAGFGMLFYGSNYWGGFAASHITQPNQSLLEESSKLPTEFKLHGGYKYLLEGDETESGKKGAEKNSLTFAANFKKQAKFNQFDIGVYYSKNLFVVGAWYRGIPLRKPYSWYRNNDAVVLLVGITSDKMNFGYSYDLTISKLTNVSSGGSHEISISYQFCNSKKKRRKRPILVSCPKF